MRKIIKRKIQISTHKRDLIDFINDEFYSHDKHNAFIEFTMKSLPTDNIIALFYFQKTKRYVETKAFVDGDKFTIEFDTSLINTDETVLGFIYFEKVAQSADVHRFSFGVKVSEIDKLHEMPIEEQTTKRVVAIEDIVTKTELDELFKRIEKNGGTYNDTEIRSSITSIEERVHTLESKPDKDTVYDDSDVKNRLSTLETNASRYLTEHQPLTSIEERIQQIESRFNNLSNIYLSSHQSLEHLATKVALNAIEQRVQQLEQNRGSDNHDFLTRQELESKHYLTSVPEEYARKSDIPQPYNDSALTERVSLLEAKAISNGAYDDKPLLEKIRAIEERHYLTSVPEEYAKKTDLYNDSELRNKITQLETNSVTKEKVESVENRVQVLENKSVVTHEELEQAGYAKTTDFTNLATNSKVEAVESRVLALENKPSVIPQAYDDSGLKARLTNLENRPQGEAYNDTDIKQRLTALEAKSTVDVSEYAKKSEVPTIDSVNNLLRTQGEQTVKISALEAKSAYEIHGTGMPNGQVEAPIGTTYVDTAVTNGALKWIKQSGSGNTGWKVLIGDTGWRTLNSVSRAGNSFIKIRRVNNLVTYQFGGLQWGWFGVGRRNGPGFVRHNSSGDKGAKLTYPNGIPEGFRSENSLVGPTYDDKGRPYGIWYLGGKSDLNFIQFTFNENIPTDKDIGDIRVSAISYVTDEDWPTRLP
nr:MAG TPA: hypothetical protein [Caudoviricetes sp.]DAU43895.1 MAG TPA: hypothetical protein [Caudoviricetes sp.]